MEDRRINIKELLYRILCSWRAIVIAMLIGALLMNGLAFLRANSNYQAAIHSNEESDPQLIQDKFESSLSEKQITQVQALASYTASCRENCQALVNYTRSSIRFHIDPECVPTLELLYMIDSNRDASSPLIIDHSYSEDIMAGFDGAITSDDVCRKMADAIDGPENTIYLRELLESVHKGNTLSIKIIADGQETCEKLADVLEEAVNEQLSPLQQIYGNFTISLVSRTYTENSNPDLLDEQANIAKSLKDLSASVAETPSGLSSEEDAYYRFLLSSQFEGKTDPQENDLARPGYLYPKYVFVGAIAGLFVVCLWIVLKVLLFGMLHSPADCTEKVLAILPIRAEKHRILAVIDRWLLNLFYRKEVAFSEENRLSMVAAAACASIEKAGMKHVLISSACNDEDIQRIKSIICQMLANQAAQTAVVSSVLEDPEALTALSGADGIIFVEHIGASNYYDVCAQNTICKEYSVPVIGYVVLR